jgi:hypothetical protein
MKEISFNGFLNKKDAPGGVFAKKKSIFLLNFDAVRHWHLTVKH